MKLSDTEKEELRNDFQKYCNTDNFSAPPYDTDIDTITDYWFQMFDSILQKNTTQKIVAVTEIHQIPQHIMDYILEKKEKDIVEDILAECQKDIDFGAEHQQMVSTRGQSRCLKIITKLNNK